MDKLHFIKILRKHLNGDATAKEEQFLFSYYSLFEDEPDVISLLNEQEKQQLKYEIDKGIWLNINKHEANTRQNNVRPMRFWRIGAAAAVLLTVISASLFFLSHKPVQKQLLISAHTPKKAINRFVRLSDGSVVIITVGSKLTVPASFDSSSKREVYLEGQAYFDIKHNPARPFIVHTGKIQVRVLGTAFNLDAWPGSENIRVTVTRGRVKVKAPDKTLGVITLNQQLTYDKLKGNTTQQTVNSDNFVVWKKQDLFCNDVTVEEVGKLLADKFNVTITYKNQAIKTKRFTTTLLKNERIERILDGVCEFTNSSYNYNKITGVVMIGDK